MSTIAILYLVALVLGVLWFYFKDSDKGPPSYP